MPCTLQPWEIEYEERAENKRKFARELTDAALLEEIACQACRTLVEQDRMDKAPPIVQKWAKLHRIKDTRNGRKWKARKET